eukprot:2065227-Ditylum_brightwellii.AAC.1
MRQHSVAVILAYIAQSYPLPSTPATQPSTRLICQPPTLSVPTSPPSLVKNWNPVQMHLSLLPHGNQ